jgi:probable phosphoglycerate mutase
LASPRGMAVELNEGILEIDFGAWAGQKLDDLRKDPLWSGVIHAPSVTRFPGGETLLEAQQRAVAAIGALGAKEPEGVVAVVSHADIIKAVLAHYSGIHLDLFQRIVVSPASVSIVDLGSGGPVIQGINLTDTLPPLSLAKDASAGVAAKAAKDQR